MNVMPGAYGCRRVKKVRVRRRAAEFRLRPRPVRHLRADRRIAADVGRRARGARSVAARGTPRARPERCKGTRCRTAASSSVDRRDGAERAERLVAREADHDRHVAVLLRLERLLRRRSRSGRRRRSAARTGAATIRSPPMSRSSSIDSRPTLCRSASPAASPCSSVTAVIGSPNGLPLMPTTL